MLSEIITPAPGLRGGSLILAAGFGRRFGADKRRHRLNDGTTLLQATVSRYVASFDSVKLVVRPEDTMLVSDIQDEFPDIDLVYAGQAHLGMGHSLAAGIHALQDWDYAFIGLGDMPFVRVDTLLKLRACMEIASRPIIVQPWFDNQAGHPVGFHRNFFPELKSLQGDQGARRVIEHNLDALQREETEDSGVLKDVDTPD